MFSEKLSISGHALANSDTKGAVPKEHGHSTKGLNIFSPGHRPGYGWKVKKSSGGTAKLLRKTPQGRLEGMPVALTEKKGGRWSSGVFILALCFPKL